MMQDISEILKCQMAQEHCSSFCALLSLEETNYDEFLQPTKQPMADRNAAAELQQFDQLGAGNRRCKGLATYS